MDLLDALNGSGRQTFSGKYYRRLPNPIDLYSQPTYEEAERSGIPFLYEYVDVYTKQYRQPIQNVISRANSDTVIKTTFSGVYCGANGNIEGFVRLQDGTTYTVTQMRQDLQRVSKQAAFFCPIPVGAEYYMTLTRIDDPFADYKRSDTVTIQSGTLDAATITVDYDETEEHDDINIQVYDGQTTEGVLIGEIKPNEEGEILFPAAIATVSGYVLFYNEDGGFTATGSNGATLVEGGEGGETAKFTVSGGNGSIVIYLD